MLALERRNQILEKLQIEKRVVVSELSQLYKVSEETIRRDLDKLEKEGYLTRNSIEGDRRKIDLQCTEQALPIIEKGRKLQQDFETALLKNTNESDRNGFFKTLEIIEENLEHLTPENH